LSSLTQQVVRQKACIRYCFFCVFVRDYLMLSLSVCCHVHLALLPRHISFMLVSTSFHHWLMSCMQMLQHTYPNIDILMYITLQVRRDLVYTRVVWSVCRCVSRVWRGTLCAVDGAVPCLSEPVARHCSAADTEHWR